MNIDLFVNLNSKEDIEKKKTKLLRKNKNKRIYNSLLENKKYAYYDAFTKYYDKDKEFAILTFNLLDKYNFFNYINLFIKQESVIEVTVDSFYEYYSEISFKEEKDIQAIFKDLESMTKLFIQFVKKGMYRNISTFTPNNDLIGLNIRHQLILTDNEFKKTFDKFILSNKNFFLKDVRIFETLNLIDPVFSCFLLDKKIEKSNWLYKTVFEVLKGNTLEDLYKEGKISMKKFYEMVEKSTDNLFNFLNYYHDVDYISLVFTQPEVNRIVNILKVEEKKGVVYKYKLTKLIIRTYLFKQYTDIPFLKDNTFDKTKYLFYRLPLIIPRKKEVSLFCKNLVRKLKSKSIELESWEIEEILNSFDTFEGENLTNLFFNNRKYCNEDKKIEERLINNYNKCIERGFKNQIGGFEILKITDRETLLYIANKKKMILSVLYNILMYENVLFLKKKDKYFIAFIDKYTNIVVL